MDHVLLVGVVNGAGQRLDEFRTLQRRPRAACQRGRQTAARHELQGEKRVPFVLAHFKDLDDIRVLEPGHCFGLDAKSINLFRRGRRPAANHLESNQPLQRGLSCEVDDAHAAPTEFLLDLVTGDCRPEGTMRIRGSGTAVRREAGECGGRDCDC